MTFQEFLEIKNAQAIVEHIETLSDAEARELIDQLDESTIELIEAVLSEITAGTMKRIERDVRLGKLSQATLDAADDVYTNRAREGQAVSRRPYGGMMRSLQRKQNREQQQYEKEERLLQGQPDRRVPAKYANYEPGSWISQRGLVTKSEGERLKSELLKKFGK